MKKPVDIIATIGPASSHVETLTAMMQAGMTVARLNFSWGTHDEHRQYIQNIRQAAQGLGMTVPIIQDLSGPRSFKDDGSHGMEESHGSVITDKDRNDLPLGLEMAVEFVAQSFVGTGEDLKELRSIIPVDGHQPRIIAKVERKLALDNIEGIVAETDAIMVARGDLGDQISYAKVPFVQKDLINRCIVAHKPVIVATEMLESMRDNERPTRAEVTDVAYAVYLGASAVMLSAETATGQYPVETIAAMRSIADEAAQHRHQQAPMLS